ncbi:type II secretion system protein [Vibrio parahaemolyticus]|uniref:Type II secretion system protein n=1 Tax=Vibrio parahaemolyticus TaxID=670 RepID=A0A9Q3UGA7_VIBPH|nr:type II secretion system protein [Vibrio parahaemolyticus]AGQ92494.1 hypothetical protein M634_16025 [Vibrio parahaemolyticus O1:Kuk str. FDA_R31]EGQ7799910.1 type II secretion system protein [Vibrio parahaemolyticus]EGQ8112410.1 type II secretion system protein [Vibrio parahaemolyticus]EGQ8200179.1 type II secretion system protein [Vibrio parahaemolyticus]EGQ8548258.1 prepilin-type N-terminal cleavage/methylation domain-containing protein [Vibrio parahaemolyticus]
MKRQGGFTLIELVVVIVILGILAVTAAPRFLNLQSDARESALQGLKGAIDGASGIVFGKAAINGLETVSSGKSVENVAVAFGYPTSETGGIGNAVTGLADDWALATSGSTSVVATFVSGDLKAGYGNTLKTITDGKCYVVYNEASASTAGNEASTSIEDSGC